MAATWLDVASFAAENGSAGATSESASSAQLLGGLQALAGELDGLEANPGEVDAARLGEAAQKLELLLRRTVQQLQALERLNLEANGDYELDFNPEPDSVIRKGGASAAPSLADICFAGALELNRALQELLRASALDDVLVAAETALRKLRRAIRAVLAAAGESALSEPPALEYLRRRGEFDLASTLAVRRLYAEFRRGLRRPESQTQNAIFMAARYAAGALATLIASPHYAHARASDRALLRRLQQRLLEWAHGERPIERGLELLDDVWTSADLLRGINCRQELRVQDCERIQRLCGPMPGTVQAWLAELAALFGLDDDLDELIDRARDDGDPELVDEIRARLRLLR